MGANSFVQIEYNDMYNWYKTEINPSASHASLLKWCKDNDVEWPLASAWQKVSQRKNARKDSQLDSGASVESTTTGELANLAQRLAEAELKAERLAQELDVITTERDKLRHELQGLTEELISAMRDAEQSKADLQQTKTDLLQGKSRTSALKLVGGMALAVYKIPIKSGRLTGLAELRRDLDSVGVAISEDVIRSHLNAAAEVI
ncbi:hypothetical protein EV669_10910 [Gulbenkiania mobilis]|uniref:Uncharacterized protein n=2 Tax=Gulbenkiania mobilis TaxID=397457 RepID=A0ABY2CU61_GULMO|nr:hypothetical protein EV669_10910 [Gulbenkiania mobilis]